MKVIYRRQSLDKSGEELGIERQLNECQRVADIRGLPVDEVITDNSVTASKRGRPGYDRLVKMVAAGQVDTIFILRIDRLLRLNDELEELIQLVENKGLRVVTAEGDIDLSTYQGRLMARILVSVARAEMEVKSERHKLANRQKAEAGKPHGARRAFGYESDGVTIKEDEALVLKDIAHRFLNGWSYRELCGYLNERGIKTAQGCEFYSITVRNMLTRKRYAGIREYQGVDFPAVWQPIYDADTWARIQYVVKQRREKAGNQPMARKYLLTGFLFCGACGGQLNGETKRDAPHKELRRTYQCKSCHGVTRGAVPLEHFISELIFYRLDVPDLSDLISRHGGVVALLDKKATLEARMNALVDDYADGTLSKLEYKRAKGRTQATLDDVSQQIKQSHQSEVVRDLAGQSVRDRWQVESDGWRRQLIGLLIERVVVRPGITKPFYLVDGVTHRFDTELIDVDWRV